jgi:hypothetical protein
MEKQIAFGPDNGPTRVGERKQDLWHTVLVMLDDVAQRLELATGFNIPAHGDRVKAASAITLA